MRVESQSSDKDIGSYCFCIFTAVCYEGLSKIQHVSKLMQSPSMQLVLLKKARDALTSLRNTGFSVALTTAKAMCNEINREAELKQKHLGTTKRHFGYEPQDESIENALRKMETTFFNVLKDTAISSTNERFHNLGEVKDKLGVFLMFPNIKK